MLDEEAFVQSIPKIELHLHLDGSLSSGNFLQLLLMNYLNYFMLYSIIPGASEQVRPVRHVPHQISEAD